MSLNKNELAEDEDYVYNWATKMSFNDRKFTLAMRLDACRDRDHWTNRMVIEALRDLADEFEQMAGENMEEIPESVDH